MLNYTRFREISPMAEVLGVRVDDISSTQAIEKAATFLAESAGHTIYTPNPEMIVLAQKDTTFRDVLNASDLSICDGKGLQLFGKITHRVQGTDFVYALCALAERREKSIYLLGSGSQKILEQTKRSLLKRYPTLRIAGMHPGPALDMQGNGTSQEVIDDINRRGPDILFVAFGHGKQEHWIAKHIDRMPTVCIAMGIGGALDFISGSIRRAPRIMRSFGFEWLWRLIMQPKRIKRIFTAVVIFPFLCFRSR